MRYLLVAQLLLVTACNSEEGTPNQPPKPAPSAFTGKRPRGMRNCPSAVPTAVTLATPVPDGIDLTITSPDPQARIEITSRAQLQVKLLPRTTGGVKHDGMHSGPEGIGFCPIVHADAAVTVDPVSDGVRVHLKTAPGNVKALQQRVAERVRELRPSS